MSSQTTVIDRKGTRVSVDTSKWTLSGLDISNKNSGNVGIGVGNPTAKFDVNGSVRIRNFSVKIDSLQNGISTDSLVVWRRGDSVLRKITPNRLSLLGGDVIGTIGADTVIGLRGRAISTTAPADGQVLTWDATTSTWRPAGGFQVVTVAGTTYTLSSSDLGKILDFTSNTAITLTVPSTLTVGFQVSITQAGTGQITFVGSGGMVINNRWSGTKTSGRWAKAGIEIRATNSAVLSGDVQ